MHHARVRECEFLGCLGRRVRAHACEHAGVRRVTPWVGASNQQSPAPDAREPLLREAPDSPGRGIDKAGGSELKLGVSGDSRARGGGRAYPRSCCTPMGPAGAQAASPAPALASPPGSRSS